MRNKVIKKLAIAFALMLMVGTASLVKSSKPVSAASATQFAKKFNLKLFTFPKKYQGRWKTEKQFGNYKTKITKHTIDGIKVYKASPKVFKTGDCKIVCVRMDDSLNFIP